MCGTELEFQTNIFIDCVTDLKMIGFETNILLIVMCDAVSGFFETYMILTYGMI